MGHIDGASNVAVGDATSFSHLRHPESCVHGFVARRCSRHWNKPWQLHRPTLPRANLRRWHGSSYGNDSESRKHVKRTKLLFVSGQSGFLFEYQIAVETGR